MKISRYVVLAMLAFATSAVTDAQSVPVVVPGDQIRLRIPSAEPHERIGILVEMTPEQLLLRDATPGTASWSMPFDHISRMDVFRPDAKTHGGKGALIGMVAGFVLVGTVGYVATHDQGAEYDGIGMLLAGPGGGIGALVGFLMGRTEKVPGWKRVPLPVRVNSRGTP